MCSQPQAKSLLYVRFFPYVHVCTCGGHRARDADAPWHADVSSDDGPKKVIIIGDHVDSSASLASQLRDAMKGVLVDLTTRETKPKGITSDDGIVKPWGVGGGGGHPCMQQEAVLRGCFVDMRAALALRTACAATPRCHVRQSHTSGRANTEFPSIAAMQTSPVLNGVLGLCAWRPKGRAAYISRGDTG